MSVLFNSTISMNIHGIRQQNGIIASMAGIQVNLNNNLSMFIVQTSYPDGSMFIMFILIYWSQKGFQWDVRYKHMLVGLVKITRNKKVSRY